MRLGFTILLVIVSLALSSFANNSISIIIDNFEDNNISADPEWWTFDQVKLSTSRNPAKGSLSLVVKGKTKDWYVGGIGTYIAKQEQDLSQYSSLTMDIYGYGPGSGKVKVEVYDDDNGNWQIEQDPKKGYSPVSDDRYSYELNIDWKGWKKVKIPFSDFVDTNPNVGDNIWNPQKIGKSGGLIQMQLICLANSKIGTVHYIIDNVSFSRP